MLPTQTEIEIPLLKALTQLGGSAKPKQIYPLMTAAFPGITPDDLAETLLHGEKKWHNRIQWTRQRLIEAGQMESGGWGLWRITDKGRARLSGSNGGANAPTAPSFLELYEKYESDFREQLLGRLLALKPPDFERFARRVLMSYGFVEVTVTAISKDGGIDGHGRLTLGLATLSAAFQCKRWQGSVGRPEVDKFRGAIQGDFEQGVFFATSDFTREAREASLKKGAAPIILLNGESIVRLMIEKGIGVSRTALFAYSDELDDLIEGD
ncbi:MAG TPA: restriction endonuclease [Tepidisphaeraceae bacterium]|jgi:restriction system protein